MLIVLSLGQMAHTLFLTNDVGWVQDLHEIARAGSAFLVFASLMRYLEDHESVVVLSRTLKTAVPIALNFMAGAVPIFFAYGLFGTWCFGPISWHFQSFNQTCVTLFSMINGDALLDIFDDVATYASFHIWTLSRVYLFSFVMLNIYGFGNIFLLIMEQAYTQGGGLAFNEEEARQGSKPISPTATATEGGAAERWGRGTGGKSWPGQG